MPLSRDQIALVILALAGGEPLTPVKIQKSLFLASDKAADAFRPDSHYNFQPYDYGPFDRQVYSDVENLEREGLAKVSQRDLPLNFHPAAIRASAVDTPFGAV